jgi:hypothetical protein
MNTDMPAPQEANKNSLTKPTKHSNWLIGILGALCVGLAVVNVSKNSVIQTLRQDVQAAQKTADQESYEKGYLQAIWDAYFEQPRYVIDDSKNEPILWKQVPLDEDTKDKVVAFKTEVEREMQEGPASN